MKCQHRVNSSRPSLELSDVVRQHRVDYVRQHGPLAQGPHYVLDCLERCRTSKLGGHRRTCDRCKLVEQAYNGCRNRHCNKCQALARARWLEARRQELLPVEYFHVVFTLPEPIAALARQNPKLIYDLLFTAAKETLLEIAANPRHLGAKVGLLAVLHTWGQRLDFHPHLHCIVPGGGLSDDETSWIACRPGFFLPVRVLSAKFRGKFLSKLKKLYSAGKLTLEGPLAHLREPLRFEQLLSDAYAIDWVVYSKPPFGGPQQVLKYLARYTHRVAISNSRLLDMDDNKVTFSWKDYRNQCEQKTTRLDGVTFIRRFLLHVLPKRLIRIRHFGLFCNRLKAENLNICQRLLGKHPKTVDEDGSCDHDIDSRS